MDTEKQVESENDDKQQHITYRYENAKDNEYHPKQINSIDVSESGDLMKKINEAADNLQPIIDNKDLKIFSKYEDLNEEQLKKLLEEKNQNILKLNKQKDDTKIELTTLLKQLNKIITENAEVLYKDKTEPEKLIALQKEVENRKKELKMVKNINHFCKSQYNAIYNKFNKKKNKVNEDNGEIQLTNLKNENRKLQFDIRKIKDESITKKKDLKNIVDNKVFPKIMKTKGEEIRNLTNCKHRYFTKIQICLNSLENLIKEINHLEDSSKQRYKEDGDEALNNKINFWLDIIKSDLSGTKDEIIDKIDKNESNFLKEINKADIKTNNSNINIHNIRIKSTSFDENAFENRNNHGKSFNLNSFQFKSKASHLNNGLKNSHKNIFSKFNYFQQKPNSSLNKNKFNKKKIPSEELKNNYYKITNQNIDLNFQRDYEETNDSEYRQLLDKKTQYLETNIRLEKNIKEIEKTKKNKILNITYTVEANDKRLQQLKAQNDLLEQEILNLQNLYLLTIDRERLKIEIKEKERASKMKKVTIDEDNKNKEITNNKTKLETSLVTENIILNELNDESGKKKKKKHVVKLKEMTKNRSGYADDYIPSKIVVETREQRLERIRKKYLDENEEINENKSNDEKNNNDINQDEEKNNNEINEGENQNQEISENKINDENQNDVLNENKSDDINHENENNLNEEENKNEDILQNNPNDENNKYLDNNEKKIEIQNN